MARKPGPMEEKILRMLAKRRIQVREKAKDPLNSADTLMIIEEAMAVEREECAKIADKSDKAIGEAIRARGKMFSTG